MSKEKPLWLERAIRTYNFHVTQCKNNPRWTIPMTAKKLGRAVGPISEDIRVAQFYKVYPDKILSFKYMIHALEFLKQSKKKADIIEH